MKKATSRLAIFVLALCMCLIALPPITLPVNAETTVTNPSIVTGSDFSSAYATKLDNIFSGKISLFSNTSATFPLGTHLNNSTTYYVAGAISGKQCYIYAQAVYYYLFGDIPLHGNGYKNYWNDSTTVITNKASVSYDLFIDSGVGFGAYIRTTPNSDGSYDGADGHSMIVLSYDRSNITYLEGNADGNGLVRITTRTWNDFNSNQLSNKSRRICHIVQCNSVEYLSPLVKSSYPANCTIQVSANTTYIKSLPCSEKTDADSVNVEIASKGAQYQAIRLVNNTAGNLWYKVTAKNGSTGYMYAGDTTYVSQNISDIKGSGITVPTNHTVGTSYVLTGKVISTYNQLTGVSAYVYAGNSEQGTKETGASATVSGYTYSLGGSTIDSNTKFGSLSVGTHTYVVSATYKNYYAKSATTLGTNSGTTTVYKSTFSVVNATSCSHSYSYKVTTTPTTSAAGKLTGTCSKCSGTTTVTLPKLNTTNYSYSVTKAATCTAAGTGKYTWKTTTYGTFYFNVSIAATGHDYSYKSTIIPPTCTAQGFTIFTCHCGDNSMGNYTAPTAHNYYSYITQPTCTEQGYTTYVCMDCDKSYKADYTSMLPHSYDSWYVSRDPSISEEGVLRAQCHRCSNSSIVTLPKLDTVNYTYVEVYAATCTKSGLDRYTWNNTTYGAFEFYVTLPATNHFYMTQTIEPTCTTQGYNDCFCIKCGDSYKENFTDMLGHKYSYRLTTNPTVSTEGILTGTCSRTFGSSMDFMAGTYTRCSSTTTVTLPKLDTNNYTYEVTKEPTYTTTGTGRYTWNTKSYGEYCFEVTLPKLETAELFTLVGANMTLGNELAMNFFISSTNYTNGCYAVITKTAADGTTKTVTSGFSKYSSTLYATTFNGLAAKEMGDVLSVVVFNAEGQQISRAWTDSVKAYSMRMLPKATKATEKTVYVEMLNYGAAAQVQFNYDTENLANADLTEEQKASAIPSVEVNDQRVKGTGYIGSNLSLENQILMNMFFNGTIVNKDTYAVISFTNYNGAAKEITVQSSEYGKQGNYTIITIDDIVLADAFCLVTIDVYDAKGNVVAYSSDSIESYAARMSTGEDIFMAVAKFAQAAYNYKHS